MKQGSRLPLTLVVVGASGDLAKKKIYPALFALFCQGFLPADFRVMGFSRSQFSEAEFRGHVEERLTCRYVPGEHCARKTETFLSHCHYHRGDYESADSYLDLYQRMQELEGGSEVNRVFYMAIPPSIFLQVARALGDAGLVHCGEKEPWSRVVVEKPFGRDRASSDELARGMAHVFSEEDTYRIDHYLGKEVIQNLQVLRFANLVFEPLWNRRYIRSIRITWKEDIGVEGRAGYFDSFGIIRDVMQNHLLQMLALVAMEPPAKLNAQDVRNAKVNVLRAVSPPGLDRIATGQYGSGRRGGLEARPYRAEPGVPPDSRTPTYAAVVLEVGTERWKGVPFLLTAGKGCDCRMTEIRIQFREVPGCMFGSVGGCPGTNELVIRVQPDEAITLRVINKVPGLDLRLQPTRLDLNYRTAFAGEIPEAYESLLLDVIRGDKSLFIRRDELDAAWDVFTPVLHELEQRQMEPELYGSFSAGPATADELARRYGLVGMNDKEGKVV
jgi:glucose-6-phosphate 1-dehydrogenase